MTNKIAERLKEFKSDNIYVLGYPISSYAIAALDILGTERYDGDDPEIKDLIEGLPLTFAK